MALNRDRFICLFAMTPLDRLLSNRTPRGLGLFVIVLLFCVYSTKPQCSSVCHNEDSDSGRIILAYDHRVNTTFDHFNSRIYKLETQMIQLNETMKQYYMSIDRTRALLHLESIMKELFIRQSVVHSSVKELEQKVVVSSNNYSSDPRIVNTMRKIDDIHDRLLQAKQIHSQMSNINTIITSLLDKLSHHALPLSSSLHSLQTQVNNLHIQSQRVNESIKLVDTSIRYYQDHCQLESIYEEMSARITVQVQKQISNFTCYPNNISVANNDILPVEIDLPHDTFSSIAAVSILLKDNKIPSLDYALSTAGGRIIRDLTSSSYFPVEYYLDTMLKRMLIRSGYHALVSYIPAWTGLSLYKLLQLDEIVITPQVVLSIDKQFIPCWPMQGSSGNITVQLSSKIIVTSITIDYAVRVNQTDFSSAPYQFQVYSYDSESNLECLLIEDGMFLITNAANIASQNFPTSSSPFTQPQSKQQLQQRQQQQQHQQHPCSALPVDVLTLRVLSNHGHSHYTCIERFRVHSN